MFAFSSLHEWALCGKRLVDYDLRVILIGLEFAFGIFVAILCVGVGASLLRLAYEYLQRRSEQKQLANRSIGQL